MPLQRKIVEVFVAISCLSLAAARLLAQSPSQQFSATEPYEFKPVTIVADGHVLAPALGIFRREMR
jgi:hypothetical protein